MHTPVSSTRDHDLLLFTVHQTKSQTSGFTEGTQKGIWRRIQTAKTGACGLNLRATTTCTNQQGLPHIGVAAHRFLATN